MQLEGRAVVATAQSTGCLPISSRITPPTSPTARSPFPASTRRSTALPPTAAGFAVCTNKLEGLSRLLLDALGLTRRFAAICGQDTFGIQKPDPEILRRTIQAAGGDIRRAVMVGDSGTDIATARAAGVPVVAVDFGYSETPIAELGADRLISHFDELAAAVLELAPDGAMSGRTAANVL